MQQVEEVSIPRDEILREFPGFKNSRSTIGDVKELKALIERDGLLAPPIVWETTDADGETVYVLIAGYRRLKAIEELVDEVDGADEAFAEISCVLFKGNLDDALKLNLTENIAREDLVPMDAAEAVLYYYGRLGKQELVAEQLQKSQSWVSGCLKLAQCLCARGKAALRNNDLPDTKEETITLAQAKVLCALVTSDKRPDVVKQEELIDKWNAGKGGGEKPATKSIKTIRTKDEVLAMKNRIASLDHDKIDRSHQESVITALRWYHRELDDEQVLLRQPIIAPVEVEQPVVEETPAVAEAPKKRRLAAVIKKKE